MESYASELKSFFECLRNNKEPSPNGEDGLVNAIIGTAVQRSYEENRPVKISEIKI
jgi:myo-inositol 2-dehydrogenase/D-chiro-inositol 1-dehydrogenase